MKDGTRANIWVRIQEDPTLIEELANDLTALYIAGAIRRVSSGGNGPRALILSPDEKTLYVVCSGDGGGGTSTDVRLQSSDVMFSSPPSLEFGAQAILLVHATPLVI